MILEVVMENHQPHSMVVSALSPTLYAHYHAILHPKRFANLEKTWLSGT
jgi:hypothetical protein